MYRALPTKPSLTHLKHQAKDLVKAHSRADATVCDTLRLLHGFAEATDEEVLSAEITLSQAQFALALSYGFTSWDALKEHVESRRQPSTMMRADREAEEVVMSLPMPTSDAAVTIDLSSLTLDDVRLGDDFIGTADLAVRQESDDRGPFALLDFQPRPGMSKWITAIVGLPQFEVRHGVSSIELEAWNPGVPLRVVVDGTDPQAECFEIAFCPNDTVWEGWTTFRVPLIGDERGEVSMDRPIIPPVRIKWLIVIMRQGLPWKLGLRSLRLSPVKGPVPAFVAPNQRLQLTGDSRDGQ